MAVKSTNDFEAEMARRFVGGKPTEENTENVRSPSSGSQSRFLVHALHQHSLVGEPAGRKPVLEICGGAIAG